MTQRTLNLRQLLGGPKIRQIQRYRNMDRLAQILFRKWEKDPVLAKRLEAAEIDLKYLCYLIEHLVNTKQL